MKTNIQFDKYSKFYDSLYITKDYKSEVKFIDQVIKKYSKLKGKKILSLGCGTCNHDILLVNKGYEITGVDMSSTMLEIARKKIIEEKASNKITLIQSDVRKIRIEKQHDIAMAMFNVIGYQTKNRDIDSTLQSVFKALKKKGLFIFDCWYTTAVLADKPSDRIREIEINGSKIIRLTQSVLNFNEDLININFHVMEIRNKKIVNEAKETHSMRYWSIPEIETILDKNGFDMVKICKFMELKSTPDEKNWNIFVIAKKK